MESNAVMFGSIFRKGVICEWEQGSIFSQIHAISFPLKTYISGEKGSNRVLK